MQKIMEDQLGISESPLLLYEIKITDWNSTSHPINGTNLSDLSHTSLSINHASSFPLDANGIFILVIAAIGTVA